MQMIVLGMHRSGTSLVTRMVNLMGAYIGPQGSTIGFTYDNPKGYWERKDVIEYNIELLKLHNIDWAGYHPTWPIAYDLRKIPAPLHDKMRSLVLTMDAHSPWVMKDPRLCLTLPYWQPLLKSPICIIVYRDPHEIAQSMHMRRHDAIPLQRGVALWELYAVSLLNASRHLPRIFIAHSDFLHDPVNTTAQLYNALVQNKVSGLKLPTSQEIHSFIDPALYRSKPAQTHTLSSFQQQLISLLCGDQIFSGELSLSQESKKLLGLV